MSYNTCIASSYSTVQTQSATVFCLHYIKIHKDKVGLYFYFSFYQNLFRSRHGSTSTKKKIEKPLHVVIALSYSIADQKRRETEAPSITATQAVTLVGCPCTSSGTGQGKEEGKKEQVGCCLSN